MIENRDQVFDRVGNFNWEPTPKPLSDKVQALKNAIIESVASEASQPITHLALSGGVDSSLVLVLLRTLRRKVVAHTMASSLDHPDMVHAKLVAESVGAQWKPHVVKPEPTDLEQCNEMLGVGKRVDNYWYLFREISRHTERVLTCDCIDELLGGYYGHKNPASFQHYLGQLIPNHLEQSDKASTGWGVEVRLPYGEPAVMAAASEFAFEELSNSKGRKQPLYAIAAEAGVPEAILTRRKYGLISAINPDEGR